MIEYLKLEDIAEERGEYPTKVARTLLRLGCDLYLHFGPSRESRYGVSFYPEHPTEQFQTLLPIANVVNFLGLSILYVFKFS